MCVLFDLLRSFVRQLLLPRLDSRTISTRSARDIRQLIHEHEIVHSLQLQQP